MSSNKSDFFRDLEELDQLSDDAQTNAADFSTLLKTLSSPASSTKVSKLKSFSPTFSRASSVPQLRASKSRDDKTCPKTSGDTLSESQSKSDNEMKRSIESSNLGPQRGPKKRRTESSRVIPESKQIFKGLTFFFIPNNGTAPARKLRIQRSQEYGALWAQTWSAEVTHVIVDKGLNFEEICKVLSSEQLAVSVGLCLILVFLLRKSIGESSDRQSRLPF
jgi:DNA polymerase IV